MADIIRTIVINRQCVRLDIKKEIAISNASPSDKCCCVGAGNQVALSSSGCLVEFCDWMIFIQNSKISVVYMMFIIQLYTAVVPIW